MNNKSFLCAILFMIILSSNYSYADNDLYEWCVNSYPNKTDWCSKQYSKTVPNNKLSETDNSNNISNEAKNEENNIIEAINARSKTTHEYVLFTDIRQSGNVICASDGIAWAVAEKNGQYYAVNGLARAWSTDMAVYTSKKWKKVVDAGFAGDSVFSRDETSKIIQTANDLCPISKGDFIGETWRRLKLGEQRAQEIGHKYGM